MAFQVRIFHSLLLGVIGMVLLFYSALYSTSSGPFFSMNAVSGRGLNQVTKDLAEDTNAYTFLPEKKVLPSHVDNIEVENISKTQSSTTSTRLPSVTSIPEIPTSNVPSQSAVSKSVSVSVKPVTESKETSNVASGKAVLTETIFEPEFVIPNAELCPNSGENLKLVVLITTAPNHRDARMGIRYTWGTYRNRKDVAIAFLLGSVKDDATKKSINEESDMFGDIVSSRFIDTYNNLTLKTISMLEWVDKYCHKVKYVLKTDDDMFINIPRLLSYIDKHINDKRTIFGRLAKKWKPIRNSKSKYYVSPDQYKPAIFPDFTTGPAYLLTSDIVHDLYVNSLKKTYLKLEDVYITGIVAQDLKVVRKHAHEFLNKRITFNACSIQKGISVHMVKYHEQFDLWKKLLDGKTKCNTGN